MSGSNMSIIVYLGEENLSSNQFTTIVPHPILQTIFYIYS